MYDKHAESRTDYQPSSEAIAETPALVDANGVHLLPVGEIPPGILGLMFHHITNQEMIVEAALTGNKNLALQALVNDPLVRNVEDAPKMLEELLQANAEYLSQFHPQRTRIQNSCTMRSYLSKAKSFASGD